MGRGGNDGMGGGDRTGPSATAGPPAGAGPDGRRPAGEETERPTAEHGRDAGGAPDLGDTEGSPDEGGGPDIDYGEGEPRVGDADLRARRAAESADRPAGDTTRPDASAAPYTHAIRGFPPERQENYPVAGGAVAAADAAADAEEAAAAAHEPMGPGGYVEERDITGGPATALADRSADPTHAPQGTPESVILEGPEAGPVFHEEPAAPISEAVPPLGEAVSRHRRGEEQESRVVLDATLGSRWLLPLTASLHVTRAWVRDTALGLETNDPRAAWHAIRAVLATLRDQLPVAEVADLAAELPVVVRGAWYEGWSGRTERAADHAAFVAAVAARLGPEVQVDPEAAVRAVVKVLRDHVSTGEMRHVYGVLPRELKGMLTPV